MYAFRSADYGTNAMRLLKLDVSIFMCNETVLVHTS